MLLPPQSRTPWQLNPLPDKAALNEAFVGMPLSELRTPALIIDRSVFKANCERMGEKAKTFGSSFRAHVKSHKTVEGTRLMIEGRSKAVITSTMMEAWELYRSGLFADNTINDLLYGLPLSLANLSDISSLQDELDALPRDEGVQGGKIRVMVDNVKQVEAIEAFMRVEGQEPGKNEVRRWSCFLKVDSGGDRAGLPVEDEAFKSLVQKIIESPVMDLFGLYCHAGQSYGSQSLPEAHAFLTEEIRCAARAATLANEYIATLLPTSSSAQYYSSNGREERKKRFVISVGSTPTAWSTSWDEDLKELDGQLELHAGNYPLLDLQQVQTSLCTLGDISVSVLTSLISHYPGRGKSVPGTDEWMCDAGGMAMSKDVATGGFDPNTGYGMAKGEEGKGWVLGRVSQEHGVLTTDSKSAASLEIGQKLFIRPQHACMTCAAHRWFYIVDSSIGGGQEVVDVWVPWKGW